MPRDLGSGLDFVYCDLGEAIEQGIYVGVLNLFGFVLLGSALCWLCNFGLLFKLSVP